MRFSLLFSILALAAPQAFGIARVTMAFQRAQAQCGSQGPLKTWRSYQDDHPNNHVKYDARMRGNAGKLHSFVPPCRPSRKKGYTQPRNFH
ncbi:hypothetical protein [Micavibrio aeruginosavorus]|uniref:hypothetical protein n=1 Tax=Micavibrio aeruginosavorus TaxID=349221 RepID=UPI003F4AF438